MDRVPTLAGVKAYFSGVAEMNRLKAHATAGVITDDVSAYSKMRLAVMVEVSYNLNLSVGAVIGVFKPDAPFSLSFLN